ncbi:SusC/RagA family TonB-linked outer membrane protein [Chitinophaga rhizosphaerae]|uniref:SusC/RagA family TonB-linked outer membrane protein n=1 Tax=Chitinophaga rhizosphaerae TaxID=1864947 RepID=UPI000F805DED|nr:SusC/RagA family TonB-linked outer membrane protein [Chitinophaga rhizosphaerae]
MHYILQPLLRVALLALILALPCIPAWAQTLVSGKVASEDSQPVPGVTVKVKGGNTGTVTDADGKFSISCASDAVLQFTSLGFIRQEVPVNGQSSINVILVTDKKSLDEVVVTALGIKKEKKAVGFSVQEVKGADLVKAREPNAINSLSGKVSGLLIASSPNLFGNPDIRLRGVKPLIVVDGVPISSDSWNLSPDDIESYSVLKGPTASALYGSRGQFGAIQITTKRGATGTRVEFNTSHQLQAGYNAIPKTQNDYGPGDYGKYAFGDGKGGGINDVDYNQWGPKFNQKDPNTASGWMELPQFDSPIDPATGKPVPTPWLQRGPDNLKNFLRNGLLSTANVALSSRNEKTDLRISASHTYQRGQVPNTYVNISNVNAAGGINLTDKLRIDVNVNYNKQYTPNFPNVAYGPNSFIYYLTLWGGADFDVRDLKNYWQKGKEGIQQYNFEYFRYNNPWFVANEWLRGYYKDDVYGFVSLNYKLAKDLNVMVRTHINTSNLYENNKLPYSAGAYEANLKGKYREWWTYNFENNTDFLLTWDKKLGRKFDLSTHAGANLRTLNTRNIYAETADLLVPMWYNFENTSEPKRPTNYTATKQVASAYASADLAFNNYLFLGLTGRVDRSSTLPISNNTYFYPSISLGAVISDMVKLPSAISFLKLRGSYARVGGDLDIYSNVASYSLGTRWAGMPSAYYTDKIFNSQIEPAFSSSLEAGIDMRFLKNRVGLDVAWFRSLDGPQVFDNPVSEASGYVTKKLNGLKYLRKGLEATLTATPVIAGGFRWDVMANWSTYKPYLKEIYGNQTKLKYIKVGERSDAYYVTDFQRSPDGKIVYGTDGLPISDNIPKKIGYFTPDWFGGLTNTFTYGNWRFTFMVDGRFGGKTLNYVNQKLWQGGRHPDAAPPERIKDALRDGNDNTIPHWTGDGVIVTSGELKRDGDGNVISDTRKFAPNTYKTTYQDWAYRLMGAEVSNVIDQSFLKLRDVTLTYNLPAKTLQHTFFKSANVSLVGRNLLYITKHKNIDLDQFVDGANGLQTPSVKSYGVNLNFTF